MQRIRVQALVVREGRILMVKHSHEGVEWWCLPGGAQEPSETAEEGALRELKEECSLDGEVVRILSQTWHTPEDEAITFLVKVGEQEPVLGYDPEVEEGTQASVLADAQWLRLAEIPERDRAFLWASGLLSVPGFFEEVESWGDWTSYPHR